MIGMTPKGSLALRRAAACIAVELTAVLALAPAPACAVPQAVTVVAPRNAGPRVALAAREVRRYLYLRTGALARIARADALPASGDLVVIATRGARLLPASVRGSSASLKPEQYLLRTLKVGPRRRAVIIAGGDEAGALYGAYRFAERLGVRFYLHGDVVPDGRIPLALPVLNERRSPLFGTRGIQPFHDFHEGPDWWGVDEYRAVLAQLPKLGMNFLGLHTYPEPIAEPTVWIGVPEDIGPEGAVRFAYPTSYQNTLRGDWGYGAKRTSLFVNGAADLFDRDDFGGEVMRDLCPKPATPEQSNELFRRTGALLRDAFTFGHRLGVRACVGTEVPLTVPALVQQRLRAAGKDPASDDTLRELYRGIFRRIAQTHPLDTYWFWTNEGWTWSGADEASARAVLRDLRIAQEALDAEGRPFGLATCGWVLGPPWDRALFDRDLPRDWAMSCINQQVGMAPVEPGFAKIRGREKWAIPWLEDDPALTSPQLWAGRMRRDAFDARAYGCTGLLGIHWRTRPLGPNVAALAAAAWDQRDIASAAPAEGPEGGQVAKYDAPIEGTDEDPIYQDVRYAVNGYRFRVPNGRYRVTLKFCEVHYDAPNKRVFDVRVQGRTVVDALDIFARVGKNRALDFTCDDVVVRNGVLQIGFGYRIELPAIAAIVVEGPGVVRRVNCGGGAWGRYTADLPPTPRDAPSEGFWRDWAIAQFGPEAGPAAAAIFGRLDGQLPRPTDWVDGPGGLRPDGRPWEQVAPEYAYVTQMERLAPQVRGQGARDRFAYWLASFRYMRATARLRCAWGAYNALAAAVRAEPDPSARSRRAREELLPARRQIVEALGEVYRHLLATVGTTGELGTVANWEQHILPSLIEQPTAELEGWLGGPLPQEATPSRTYRGPIRLIVPTARPSLLADEPLRVRALVLCEGAPREVALVWRPMGERAWMKQPLAHVARGVYSGAIAREAIAGRDIEWYVTATAPDHRRAVFPATAPAQCATTVRMP